MLVRILFNSGAEGSRTLDLLNAIQALSQLSYSPVLVRTLFKSETLGGLQGALENPDAPFLAILYGFCPGSTKGAHLFVVRVIETTRRVS
jgi:hypothetical protein